MCSCLCGLNLDILSADMSKSAQSRKVTTHSSGSLQNTKFLDETKTTNTAFHLKCLIWNEISFTKIKLYT